MKELYIKHVAGLLGVPASDDWEGISRISGT